MAGRSDRDGIGGRRGSLDSNKSGRKPYVYPFKCSIDPPRFNLNMEHLHSPTADYPIFAQHGSNYAEAIESLKKENFNLKLRLYLRERELVQNGICIKPDVDLVTAVDAMAIKDTLVSEAIKTATANEQKFLEAQLKVEMLESEKELTIKQLEEDLQHAIKAKDEKIKMMENELIEMKKKFEDRDLCYMKAKKLIQKLFKENKKLSKKPEDEKFPAKELNFSDEDSDLNATYVSSPKSEPLEIDDIHYHSFKEEVERAKRKAKELEDALSAKGKQLEEKSSEISSYVKELKIKQETLEGLNNKMQLLSKTNDCLKEKLYEKEQQVESLTNDLQNLQKSHLQNDTKQLEAVESPSSSERRNAVRKDLSGDFNGKDVSPMVDEISQTSGTSLEEGTLPIFSEVEYAELKDRASALEFQLQDVMNQKSVIMSQYNVLLRHVEKLARFMEKLISDCSRLSITGDEDMATAAFLTEAQECLDKAKQFSLSLAHDASSLEHRSFSRMTIGPFSSSSSHFESTRYSMFSKPSAEAVAEVPWEQTIEGSTSNAAFPLDYVSGASQGSLKKRRRWSTSLSDKPSVNLDFSDFPDICPLESSECEEERSSITKFDAAHSKVNQPLKNGSSVISKPRMCWDVDESQHAKRVSIILSKIRKGFSPLKENRVSSDSDVWSEPDRDLSVQRVGIQMEKPLQSPLQRHFRSRSMGEEHRTRSSSVSTPDGTRLNRTIGSLPPYDHRNTQMAAISSSLSCSDNRHSLSSKDGELQTPVKNYETEKSGYKKLLGSKTSDRLTAERLGIVKDAQEQKTVLLTDNCVQTEAEIATKSADAVCKELQNELKSIKGKLKDMEVRCLKYEKEIDSLRDENKNLTSHNNSLEQALGLNKQAIDDISAKYQKANALLSEEQQKCSKLLTENTSLQSLVEELRCSVNVCSDHEKELQQNSMLKNISCNTSALACLPASDTSQCAEQTIKEEDTEIFRLKTMVSDLRQKLKKITWKKDFFLVTKTVLIGRLNAEIKEKDEQINKLTSDMEKAQLLQSDIARAEEIQKSLQQYQEEICHLRAEIECKTAISKRLESELQSSLQSIETLTSEVENKDAEIQNFMAKVEIIGDQLTKKDSDIQALNSEVLNTRESIRALSAEIESKDKTMKELTAHLKDLKEQYSAIEQRESCLKSEKMDLLDSISSYSIETKDIRMQLFELQKEMDGRNACEQKMESRLHDLKQQLDLKNERLMLVEKENIELKNIKEECEKLHLLNSQMGSCLGDSGALSNELKNKALFDVQHLLSEIVKVQAVEIKSGKPCNALRNKIFNLSKLMQVLWSQFEESGQCGKVIVNTQAVSVMWDIIALVASEMPDLNMADLNLLCSIGSDAMTYETQLQDEITTLKKQIALLTERNELEAVLKEKTSSPKKQAILSEETTHSETKLRDKLVAFERQLTMMEATLKSERKSKSLLEEQKCLLQKQLAEKDEILEGLAKAKGETEAQLEKLVKQVFVMKTKQAEIEEKMAELHQELLEKESLIENLSSDNDCLHSSLNQIKKTDHDVSSLESMLSTLENELKLKCTTIETLQQKIDADEKISNQHQEEITKQSDQINHLENMLKEYSRLNEQQSHDLEIRLKQVAKYENELRNLYEQVNSNKRQIDAKEQLIEKYETDVKQSKTLIENLQSHYEAKLKEFNEFYNKHQNCKMTTLREQKSQGTTCSVDSRDVGSQIDSPERLSPAKPDPSKLQQQLTEAVGLINSLQCTIKTLEEENVNLKKQVGEYNVFIKTLSDEKRLCNSTLATLQKELESVEQVKGQLVNKVLFSDSCIRHLNEDKQKLLLQIEEHQLHAKELQSSLKATKSELTASQNMWSVNNTHIGQLEKELQKKSQVIQELKIDNSKNADDLSQLKSASETDAKCISMQKEELKIKTLYLSQLKSKLDETANVIDQLKKELGSKAKLIEKLEADLAAETERNNNLQLNLKLKLDVMDLQKSGLDDADKLEAYLQQKCLVTKHLEEKEAEKLKFIEELSGQVKERCCQCKEANGKLKSNEQMMSKQAQTVHQLKKIISELSSELDDLKAKQPAEGNGLHVRDNSDELPCSVREEVLNKWSNRKYWLQSSVLQLQGKLFKDIPLPQKHCSVVFDHIAALNSKIAPVSVQKAQCSQGVGDQAGSRLSTEAEKQRYLLTLQADCDFLKNLRHLMKHFVAPSLKYLLSTQFGPVGSVSSYESSQAFIKAPHRVEDVYQSILELWSTNHHSPKLQKEKAVHSSDDRSAFSFADCAVPTASVKQLEGMEMFLEGNLLSEPVSPRSNYSSPDLGIESDPNQDPTVHEQAEGGSIGQSKDSLDELSLYTGEEISTSSIHAIGLLKDYELLRKEVEECIIGFKSITFRTKEGLEALGRNASPRKLLEHTTLKAILDSCNHVEMCLSQTEQLVNQFWYGPYPCEPDKRDMSGLLRQNSELKQTLKKIVAQLKEREIALEEMKSKQDAKNRYINKHLFDTKKMLHHSKNVLERKLGQR